MPDCRDLEPMFAPYVDGDAEAHTRAKVDAHLRVCASCRDRVSGEQAAREVLQARREGLRSCASDALRQRCALQCAVTAPARRISARVLRRPWVPLSLAATLALAVAGVFFTGLNTSVEALAMQLALDHVKCFQFAPTEDSRPNASDLGRQWENTRGWPLKVPASVADQRLELIGIRRCGSTEGVTAHMMYRWRGAPLSVYVLNSASTKAGSVEQFVEKLGQDAVIWSNGARTYAIVARANPSDLEPVLTYVKRTAY